MTPHAPLRALHNKIDQALIRIGLAPEKRAYLPHITLARFARTAAPPCPGTLPVPAPIGPAVKIGEFCLYESELGSEGAVYSIVTRYPLG